MAHALIVVDFQEDFTPPEGALAVPGGDEVAPRINELMEDERFDVVVATRDWHPPGHSSFAEQGGPWPPHCIQGTPGAELHHELRRDRIDVVVDKGQEHDAAGYSGFEATGLRDLLREDEVTEVTLCGLATDYCVRHTALDAIREALTVHIAAEAVAAVDVEPGDGRRALDELAEAGADVQGAPSG